ncbi:MAG: PorP/SprF family type IX secretion system membrane protein [Flavicella sp.]
MKNLYILFALVFTVNISAQTEPQYTQYMYNMSLLNSAYSASKDYTSVGFIYRNQWAGLEGAPKTMNVFGQTKFENNLGFGGSIVSDQIGTENKTSVQVDVSYPLQIAENQFLSFGLKAGVSMHSINLSEIDSELGNFNATSPTFGAGFLYYSSNFYVGASIPNVLGTKQTTDNGDEITIDNKDFYAMAGYVLDLNSTLKLKPNVMIRATGSEPVTINLGTNVLLHNKYEFGVAYRLDESFSGLFNIPVTSNLRLGYSYDFVTTSISDFAPASHEFIVLYNFNTASETLNRFF